MFADREKVLVGLAGLSEEQKCALVDAISDAVRGDFLNWKAMVGEVATEVRTFDPPFINRLEPYIENVIIACQEDDDSFDRLIDKITTPLDDEDEALARLLKFIDQTLGRAALTKVELTELLSLQPDRVVAEEQLPAGIRRASNGRYSGVIFDSHQVRNVREAALLLLDHRPPETGLQRLLHFVGWLAGMASHLSESAMAEGLRSWVRQVTNAHRLSAEFHGPASRQYTSTPPAGAGDGPVLLIELDSTTSSKEGFQVNLWIWKPGFDPQVLDWDRSWCREDAWCRLDELEQRSDDLLSRAIGELVDTEGELRVEFWLDYGLLHRDVDWWRFGAKQGRTRPLGAKHVVTVRPRRRTKHRMLANEEAYDWRRRWKALQDPASSRTVNQLGVWVEDQSTHRDEDLENLLDDIADNLATILITPLGPCEHIDGRLQALLHLALHQGLPVALCLRRTPADAARFLEDLKEQLAGKTLTELPELVRTWRRQASRAERTGMDHFGRHLVLLWDDYDRQLPDRERNPLGLPVENPKGPD